MRHSETPLVAFVVPCYNEELGLQVTMSALGKVLAELTATGRASPRSLAIYVDDGSRDQTWHLIEQAANANPGRIVGIRLVRNVGHQNALMAGLDYATKHADLSISIDADLQDDVSVIPEMIDRYRSGAEIVAGVRSSRETDTPFKRGTAKIFYGLMRAMGVPLIEHHADFRLLSKAAMLNLSQYPERHLFLRGLSPLLHSRIEQVTYSRKERLAGETNYTLAKMLGLAIDGVTSLSVFPLRLIAIAGALIFLASMLAVIYALVGLVIGETVPGWASITAPLYALGGIQMLSLGVVGEYVGKVFIQSKQRPRYLIDEIVARDG